VARKTKAQKLAEFAKQTRLQRAIYGYRIPMLSIPALYRLLEVAADAGQNDAELKAIVEIYPGVEKADTLAREAGKAIEQAYPWGYRSGDSEP